MSESGEYSEVSDSIMMQNLMITRLHIASVACLTESYS